MALSFQFPIMNTCDIALGQNLVYNNFQDPYGTFLGEKTG